MINKILSKKNVKIIITVVICCLIIASAVTGFKRWMYFTNLADSIIGIQAFYEMADEYEEFLDVEEENVVEIVQNVEENFLTMEKYRVNHSVFFFVKDDLGLMREFTENRDLWEVLPEDEKEILRISYRYNKLFADKYDERFLSWHWQFLLPF